jgi:hypothetical protein
LSFGLKNIGATYQRAIQTCLGEQIGDNTKTYVNDDGLNNDKEPSNKKIFKKDKEQGQDELARIHSPGCPSLHTNTPNPN